ncbi:MAG: flagellar assembly protein FliH [Treponema sp.]|jgi:flagellar assembly protein FliH|nr:flagellar assembly protein FliH [Treponema sp.]
MTKAVFRYGEVALNDSKVVLESPQSFVALDHPVQAEEEVAETAAVEEYQGPTAEDLRREAELFKSQWDVERETMIRSAKAEADSIIKDAEAAAFQEVKRKTGEAQSLKRAAEDEAEGILEAARQKAAEFEAASQAAIANERRGAEEQGRLAGREAGFNDGKAEVERLIQRTQVMLERAQEKRAEILAETEQQIIDLVLLISRKVIKVISENQRSVILSNVVQALKKVKGRGTVIIRVNLMDVKLATEHIKDFIQMMEGVKSIQVQEDASVDPGGCIIETDFGEIDARISSQLAELESKILEMTPIKSKPKPVSGSEGSQS